MDRVKNSGFRERKGWLVGIVEESLDGGWFHQTILPFHTAQYCQQKQKIYER